MGEYNYTNTRINLKCKRCGMSFFGVNDTVQFCSLVCEAGDAAHCNKCKTPLLTNTEISNQLCKGCCYRRSYNKCSRCGNRVSIEGIFKIEDEEMCGTCVGKLFRKDLEVTKEKYVKKEERNGKERRIILD